MTGLMISSYFIINRLKIKVEDLFVGSSRSIYWYTYGINWRAAVAVCLPNIYPPDSDVLTGAVGMRSDTLSSRLRRARQ